MRRPASSLILTRWDRHTQKDNYSCQKKRKLQRLSAESLFFQSVNHLRLSSIMEESKRRNDLVRLSIRRWCSFISSVNSWNSFQHTPSFIHSFIHSNVWHFSFRFSEYKMFWLTIFLLHFVTWQIVTSEPRQCQSITYYECKNIGYNQTYLPNKFNHQDQKDVALVVWKREDIIWRIISIHSFIHFLIYWQKISNWYVKTTHLVLFLFRSINLPLWLLLDVHRNFVFFFVLSICPYVLLITPIQFFLVVK